MMIFHDVEDIALGFLLMSQVDLSETDVTLSQLDPSSNPNLAQMSTQVRIT